MKCLYLTSVVRAAAPVALKYWQQAFDERKEAWIADVAAKKVGWFRKCEIGRENAEKYFDSGFMFDDCPPYYANGGLYWHEMSRIETLTYLINLTKNPGCDLLILKQEEIAALSAGITDETVADIPVGTVFADLLAKDGDGQS